MLLLHGTNCKPLFATYQKNNALLHKIFNSRHLKLLIKYPAFTLYLKLNTNLSQLFLKLRIRTLHGCIEVIIFLSDYLFSNMPGKLLRRKPKQYTVIINFSIYTYNCCRCSLKKILRLDFCKTFMVTSLPSAAYSCWYT